MAISYTFPLVQVQKRDGTLQPFDRIRMERALALCFLDMHQLPQTRIQAMVQHAVEALVTRNPTGPWEVEAIQDAVEDALVAAGERDAARHYMRYRLEHETKREQRPIPEPTRVAFDRSAEAFPTPIQQFMFYDKYARFDMFAGRRETWDETVWRATDFLMELVQEHLHGDVLEEVIPWSTLREAIRAMKVMPSMRLLAMAGPAARRQNLSIYNCLSGDEQFITRDGPRMFHEAAGQTVEVLAGDGQWRPAEIKAFGMQPVNTITLKHWNGGKPGSYRHHVKATADHRWVLYDGTVTTALKVGDKLAAPDLTETIAKDPEAVRHGFIYGDGTINHQPSGDYVQVRLCGDKAQYLETIFAGCKVSYPPSQNGDPTVYCGKHAEWKRLPTTTRAEYVAGFIHGLGLADGSRNTSGNLRIDTQQEDLVYWLISHAGIAGYKVLSHRTYTEDTNFGPRSAPLHQVLLGIGDRAILQVEAIEPYAQVPVFCAVEPVTHTFTLANGQVTGNCSFMPVADLKAFPEALLISMAGCGVGFSVERQFVEQFPRIQRQHGVPPITWEVEDSTEGWAQALTIGLEMWFAGEDIVFDYSAVRPAGAILKTKGGRASGPEPLRLMLDGVRARILARQGSFLRPIDAHDLMCLVGNAAVMGGTRRTAMISLFDWDDLEMRHCKDGDLTGNEQRWNANNSAVWPERGLTQVELLEQFLDMARAGRGEPGIFNRASARALRPARREDSTFGTNPCGEIILRPYELCNLSVAVARREDTREALAEKVRLATIIGTIQSLATHFPGMRDEWRRNAEQERLLGVDITGQQDCPLLTSSAREECLSFLRQVAVETNATLAEALGIHQSVAVTCVKPSGNSSQLLNCASGLHPRWAPYYLRNIRVGKHTPLYQVLKDAGAPMQDEVGPAGASTAVISFPVKAPEGAVTRHDLSAIAQCEHWLANKRHYTEHNPSVTVTYKPDELLDVVRWVWEHQQEIGGMAFLPASDANYALMPYQEITQAEYEVRAAMFPEIDYAKLVYHEDSDWTSAAQEVACLSGACEL